MMEHRWTAIVTIVALLVYFYMSLHVGRAARPASRRPP
jgi:hypothetical protein